MSAWTAPTAPGDKRIEVYDRDVAAAWSDPDERPCRGCGSTDLECDGPPARCCDTCTHWTPQPHPTDHTRTQR